jgi:hypothetical protein
MAEWQDALARYLSGLVAGGRYPYLAAALTGEGEDAAPSAARAQGDDRGQGDGARHVQGSGRAGDATRAAGSAEPPPPVFDRTLARILTGLLTATGR